MVVMATSLSFRVSTISAFCRPTTQTPSITNRLVAIVHRKPVIAILVPKLVTMATSLRSLISAMSSSDRLIPKTYPKIKQQVASCHTAEVISIQNLLAAPHTLREQPISGMGW